MDNQYFIHEHPAKMNAFLIFITSAELKPERDSVESAI